jgi:hypothetical protein
VGITTSQFYLEEAVRCQKRAEASRNPERATRWRKLAEEYLQLAISMDDQGEVAPHMASSQDQRQPAQQAQSKLR